MKTAATGGTLQNHTLARMPKPKPGALGAEFAIRSAGGTRLLCEATRTILRTSARKVPAQHGSETSRAQAGGPDNHRAIRDDGGAESRPSGDCDLAPTAPVTRFRAFTLTRRRPESS